ncbi:MAG: PASTA domain-containing protein, partial [Deltaproteobacteria bacterium]|nr:PASTA domain-containing protein [Deltaproteobacteria bacterium]
MYPKIGFPIISSLFFTLLVSISLFASVSMAYEDITVNVITGDGTAASNIKVYAYTEAGSCTGIYATTNADGIAVFDCDSFTEGNYKFKAVILCNNYWSDVITIASGITNNASINAGGGTLHVTVGKSAGLSLSGVKVKLYNSSGSYLGIYQTTDESGMAQFSIPEGTFKIRADYLGSQYWTEDTVVTEDTNVGITIPHQDVVVTVQGLYQNEIQSIEGIKAYLYTSSGSYLYKYDTTNADGNVVFNLPELAFKVRVTYMGQQYWSDEFTWQDTTVNIPMADAVITVTGAGDLLEGVRVYVYSEEGSSLCKYGTTDETGTVTFRIPAGSYNFRAYYLGNEYWSGIQTLIEDQSSSISIDTGGGEFVLTVLKDSFDAISGVKCCLYSESGSYLCRYGKTDSEGKVSFKLPNGNFKFKVHYLGSQFWSEVYDVSDALAGAVVIPHKDVVITVQGIYQGAAESIPEIKTYLYSASGSCLGIYGKTDAEGHVIFSLPEISFKTGAYYLGQKFWSDEFTWQDTTISIPYGMASVHVTKNNSDVQDAKVYLLSEAGSCLGIYDITDISGLAEFIIPAGSYKFKAYSGGVLNYSDIAVLVADQMTPVNIDFSDPPTISFSAAPESIYAGESSELTWDAINADTVYIDHDIGYVDLNGSITVNLTETTTYTLTAIGQGGTATAGVTVTYINSAPTAYDQAVNTNEDEQVAISLTAMDADNDPLLYLVVSGPFYGVLSGDAPNLEYLADADYNGADYFTFIVNDGSVDSEAATININITPVNDIPTADAGGDQTVLEDDTVSLDGNLSGDPDGDTLSFQWAFVSMPGESSASLVDSTSSAPSFIADQSGTYEVMLIVNDGNADSLSDTVIITAEPLIVEVPDVTGMSQSEAEATLMESGLVAGGITTAYNEDIPEGYVISQQPEPGTLIETGGLIALVISLGPSDLTGNGEISGQVIDALTGEVLPDAEISLFMEQEDETFTLLSQYSSLEDGSYIFSDLPSGDYFIDAVLGDYITGENTLTLDSDDSIVVRDIVLSPLMSSGEVRIVLTWGEIPEDLEAHLTAPNTEGCRYHCFYDTREIPGASLDLDDMTSYGPETITITSFSPGTYRYYVHDFTNRTSTTSDALSLSGAQVKVYFGSGEEPVEFTVPDQDGTVWHVFDMDGDTQQITPVNIMAFQEEPGEIDFPVITSSPDKSTNIGEAYTYQVTAEDPDDDILVYSLEEYPEGMTIDQLTGEIEWTPGDDQGDYHEVVIKVSDGRCGEDEQRYQIDVTYMPIVSFSSDPCSAYNQDGTITLTWSTERAETVSIDQGIGEVASSGSLTITSPEEPVVYTLTAENELGQKQVSVPKIPTGTFNVTPTVLPATGGTAKLTWNFPCAVTCNIQGIADVLSASGSLGVDVTEVPVTYVITGRNASGSSISTASIREECSDPVVIELGSDEMCSWTPGDPVTLYWETSGCVDSCEIDQGIGEVASSGTTNINPDETTTYTISCSGASGTGQRSITLPKILAMQIGSFYAGSSNIMPGQSVKLTWTTQCAEMCTIDQGIGEVGTNNSILVTPSNLPVTYTLTATGKGETKTRSVTINPRVSATFVVSPSNLKIGESATLTWTTVNANYCEITPGIGEVDLNGTLTVQPSGNTTYKLTARGLADSDIKYVTVNYIVPTAQLLADKEVIEQGESVTLSWIFSNSETCTIDQDIGEVLGGESVVVTSEETTTYTMTAEGPGGTATDSVTITVAYPPDITIIQPDGIFDTANEYCAIKWADEDADSNAIISIYYDTDNTGYDGILIDSDIDEDIDPTYEEYDKYIWDISGMDEGEYYIYAIIDDGYHNTVTDYSDGPITIDHSISTFKITASDGLEYDNFGNSVSLDQGYAVVGAYANSDKGYQAGAAYIFRREGESWIEQLRLDADDLEENDNFGKSVSISGEYAIVGAYGDDDLGTDSGAVYIFKRSGDLWSLQDKITAPNGNNEDHFGASVSVSGDLLLIGAEGDDENGTILIEGEAYYYSPVGAAYIYKRYGSSWIMQKKLPGYNSGQTQNFGYSVDINGERAIIGAIGANNNGGRAYVFEYDGSDWVEQGELYAEEGDSSNLFGSAVSVDKDNAIVGDPYHYNTLYDSSYAGAAYMFSFEDTAWFQDTILESADIESQDLFGASVSIDGNYAIAGLTGDDDGGTNAGAAYLFKGEYDNGSIISWITKMKLIAPDFAVGDSFGGSVYLNDGYAIIGTIGDDDNGAGSGSAYIYPLYLAVNVNADPDIIEKGGSTVISWTSVLADSCVIEPDIGTVSANGSIVVSPEETTTYVVMASGTDGIVSESVTVTVVDPEVLPYAEISASPLTIGYTDSTTITWNATNAISCTTAPDIGSVSNSGSIIVSPAEDTNYTITANNSGGSTTASVTVNVVCYNPIVNVYIEPDTLELGESAVITWTSQYTDYCEIQPDVGQVYASGTVSVLPEDSIIYMLTATGQCGESVYTIPIAVNGPVSIEMTYPDCVNEYADQTCNIKWTDKGPNIDAYISLYYDTNDSGEDGTLIVSSINETPDGDSGDSYIWDTGSMPEGAYYVYAFIDDGVNTPVVDYSEGPVNILHSVADGLKVSVNNPWNYAGFGYSVAMSGDYAIVGDTADSAYIYKQDGAVWIQKARLIIEDAEGPVDCEKVVSIDGEFAIVGVENAYNSAGLRTGMACIFQRQGDTWVEQAQFEAYDIEYFGCSVSISGDYAIVGAKRGDDNIYPYNTGAAYVFKLEGTAWIEQAKLVADDGKSYDYFGYAVSIDGDYAIIGAREDDNGGLSTSGSAYIFKREGDTWIQQVKLTPDELTSNEYFGSYVAIDGDYTVVGSPYSDNSGYTNSGAMYIYQRDGESWVEQAKITDPEAVSSGRFGRSVGINSNRIIVGGDQKAIIFQNEGTDWIQLKEIIPDTDTGVFSDSVAISEDYAIVGDYGDDDAGDASGAVYFYPLAFVEISADPET